MKRPAKYLCIAAAVMLVVPGVGAWIVSRWVQSADGRATIEGRLSKSLRMPVKIKKLIFSVWSGVTAEGVSVPGDFGDVFEAARISVGHRLTSLLTGNLAFDDVRIEQPRLRIIDESPGESPPLIPITPVVTQPVVAASAPPPPTTSAAPATEKKKPQFAVRRIILDGGSADILDKQRAPVATISGLTFTLNDVSARGFTGSFEAARVTLHGCAAFDHVTGLVSQSEMEFKIRNFAATIGGGSVSGEASGTRGSTAVVSLRFDRINLAQAAQAAGAATPKLTGTLSGDVQLAGLGTNAKTITGGGNLTLKDGMCREIELMRQIGEFLQLQSVANFEIADARASFQVADERVAISPMIVSAPPLGMEVTGTAMFDGTLDLSAILHAPADFINQRALIASQFSPPDQDNRRGVQFNITGPLKKPKHNLAERVTGTNDKRQQRIIAAGEAVTTLLENTNLGKRNPKLMKLLPRLVPARPAPPTPAPAQQ